MDPNETTQPMGGPITEPLDPADYPTEKIYRIRKGSRNSGNTVLWSLFALACSAAMGGGVWFATTANAGLGTSPSVVVSTVHPTGGTTAPQVIQLPANTQTLPGTPTPSWTTTPPVAHTDVRKARVGTPTATHTTPAPVRPPDSQTPSTPPSPRHSQTPSTPPPTPVGTSPDPSNSDCVAVAYSDGSVRDACSPPPSVSSSPSGD